MPSIPTFRTRRSTPTLGYPLHPTVLRETIRCDCGYDVRSPLKVMQTRAGLTVSLLGSVAEAASRRSALYLRRINTMAASSVGSFSASESIVMGTMGPLENAWSENVARRRSAVIGLKCPP
jgi:hypothetical protein